jgi:hypothetical protein
MFYHSLVFFSLLFISRYGFLFLFLFLALRGVVLAAGWDLVRFERIWERRCQRRSVGRTELCVLCFPAQGMGAFCLALACIDHGR